MRANHRFPLRLLVGALLLAASCGDAAPAPMAASPLEISPAFLDLGSVPRGQKTSGVWTLRNSGAKPLQILRIGPMPCSCGRAELVLNERGAGNRRLPVDGSVMNLSLAAGESAEVHFTFDSSRYRQPISRKVLSIPVILADYPSPVLETGVDVWTPFVVEPWAIQLGEVGVREQASGFVLVAAHDTPNFGLSLDTEVEGWRVVSKRVSTGNLDSYQVTVTAPMELPEGAFNQEFRFHTDLPGAPPIRFFVQGIAVRDIGYSPSRVLFEPAAGRPTTELRVLHRGLDAELGSLVLEAGDLPIELTGQTIEAKNQRLLTLRWTGEIPEGLKSGRLRIQTGDENVPVIEVPWSVMPARG